MYVECVCLCECGGVNTKNTSFPLSKCLLREKGKILPRNSWLGVKCSSYKRLRWCNGGRSRLKVQSVQQGREVSHCVGSSKK